MLQENASKGLLLDRTYQLKILKPENERKKIELPAQKNLLTNYFCIHPSQFFLSINFVNLRTLYFVCSYFPPLG